MLEEMLASSEMQQEESQWVCGVSWIKACFMWILSYRKRIPQALIFTAKIIKEYRKSTFLGGRSLIFFAVKTNLSGNGRCFAVTSE